MDCTSHGIPPTRWPACGSEHDARPRPGCSMAHSCSWPAPRAQTSASWRRARRARRASRSACRTPYWRPTGPDFSADDRTSRSRSAGTRGTQPQQSSTAAGDSHWLGGNRARTGAGGDETTGSVHRGWHGRHAGRYVGDRAAGGRRHPDREAAGWSLTDGQTALDGARTLGRGRIGVCRRVSSRPPPGRDGRERPSPDGDNRAARRRGRDRRTRPVGLSVHLPPTQP